MDKKPPQERQRTFLCHELTGLDCRLDTKPCAYNKIFISGFKRIIPLFFFLLPFVGLRGSVSHLQYFRQCRMCLWGCTEKGTEVLWRHGGGACTAYEITQRNNGNQTPTGLPTLSLPPANKTVHQGKMFIQILIMYYSLETIFICSFPILQGVHCLPLL